MRSKLRLAPAAGLGLLALAALVGRSSGQAQDRAARRAANERTTAAATQTPAPAAAVIGTIDLGAILEGYEKYRAALVRFNADAQSQNRKLVEIQDQQKLVAEAMARLKADSPDYRKLVAREAELKNTFEKTRERLQGEFANREADLYATTCAEVRQMAAAVARRHRMNFVVQVAADPAPGADPKTALDALRRHVVWSDPGVDITAEVLQRLNNQYRILTGGASGTAPAAPRAR
jgi:Skp family chaperone for outer membrane proteins